MPTQAAPAQQNPYVVNQQNRSLILARALERFYPLTQTQFTPSTYGPLSLTPRNAGIIKKFVVRLTATVTNSDGANALTLTDFGLSNLIRNISFTDFQGNQRINTTGWHLSLLNSLKLKKPYAGGYALETDAMSDYGETYQILQAPATIAHSTSATVAACFEIPLAYADDDLRGSIYAGVTNANLNLTLTFGTNAQLFTATGQDSTFAMYKGTAAATLTNVNIEVYQVYLDQLPVGQNGTVLPLMDLATVYQLNTSNFGSIASNNDFPVPYANFRQFLSTFAIYNSDTSADAGRAPGTDINYWALESANFTQIWKKSPLVQALGTREILGFDPPKGTYYFPSRKKPISTANYGNMALNLNASAATVNAQLYIGWEMFAQQNALTQAGSLAG